MTNLLDVIDSIPVLLEQMRRFLEICQAHFGHMSPEERREITQYLVTEVRRAKNCFQC